MRLCSRWGGVTRSYDLPLGFTVTAAQQLFLTIFHSPNFLFSRNPPKTRSWFSRLRVYNRLILLKGFSPSNSSIREDRNSNQILLPTSDFVRKVVVRVF